MPGESYTTFAAFIAGSATALGVVLLVKGLRGRRVDNHPLCRKCGFDLTGKPENSLRCPECGAGVGPPAGIRIGNRHRRKIPLMFAALCLLIGLPILIGTALNRMAVIEVQTYKPLWMLRREAFGASVTARDAAWEQINRRVRSNRLSPSDIADLVDLALAKQASTSEPWYSPWGEFIESIHDAKTLPPDKWKRYAEQAAPVPKYDTRPRVHAVRRLPLSLTALGARVGSHSKLCLSEIEQQTWVNDVPIPRVPWGVAWGLGPSAGSSALWLLDVSNAQMPEGVNSLRLLSNYEITEGFSGPVLASGTRDTTLTFDVRPEGELLVKVITEPAVGVATQRAIKATITANPTPTVQYVHLIFDPVSVQGATGLAHEVWIRGGTRTWKLGEIVCPASRMVMHRVFPSNEGRPIVSASGELDLVLRPNPALANQRVDVDEIWGGEIVVKDLAVPTTVPTTAPTAAPTAATPPS